MAGIVSPSDSTEGNIIQFLIKSKMYMLPNIRCTLLSWLFSLLVCSLSHRRLRRTDNSTCTPFYWLNERIPYSCWAEPKIGWRNKCRAHTNRFEREIFIWHGKKSFFRGAKWCKCNVRSEWKSPKIHDFDFGRSIFATYFFIPIYLHRKSKEIR